MEKELKPNNIDKFMNLEERKRDRILNAAMKEFRYGYKRASTDTIVKEAGISKGLLFHYFGSKAQLFEFVVRYAGDKLQESFYNMLDLGQRDIIEAFWQFALLRRDINDQYPYIYDFSNGLHAHIADIPGDMKIELIKKGEVYFEDIPKRCDMSLFRDDIDGLKALDLVLWSIEGFFQYMNVKEDANDYEKFLEDLRTYLDIFRNCFYK